MLDASRRQKEHRPDGEVEGFTLRAAVTMGCPSSRPSNKSRIRCIHQACGGSAVLCVLISLLGIGIAATILAIDIPEQQESQQNKFRKVADEANLRLKSSLNDYEVSGLWVHQACRDLRMSFSEFRGVYQYITSTGLEFLEVSCALNASQSERQEYEKQSDAYLTSHYPNYYYRYIGFNGYELNPRTGEYDLGPMSNKSYYYVTHFVEPLDNANNLRSVDFDISTAQDHGDVALEAIASGNFSVTPRINYSPTQYNSSHPTEYKIIMAHPGLPLDEDEVSGGSQDHDTAIQVVLVPAILQKAYGDFIVDEDTLIYVFDSTEFAVTADEEPVFMGGVKVGHSHHPLPEVEWANVVNTSATLKLDACIFFANRQWSLVVIAPSGSYQPSYFLSIFGALMIMVASMCASLWVYTRSKARTEKAMILLTAAKNAAQGERDLNDYIAHE